MSKIVSCAEDVVIADAVRSPLGSLGPHGAVARIRPGVLLAQTAWALLDRTLLEPAAVTKVVVAGGPGFERIARDACLHLGVTAPVVVPGDASSTRGSILPAASRSVGHTDVVLVLAGSRAAARPPANDGEQLAEAERIAVRWGIGRGDLDAYARLSRQRACEVAAMGEFGPEIIPAVAWSTQSRVVVTADETIGAATDAGASDSSDHSGRLHPGNISRAAVGAAATVLLGADRALELGVRPRARILAMAGSAGPGESPDDGPMAASRAVLTRSGLVTNDLDHYEVSEELPVVPLAWQREFGADLDRFNPRSGSIGLGHPGPAAGLRSLATTLSAVEATGGRLALHVTDGPGGAGDAVLLESMPSTCCSHEALGIGLAKAPTWRAAAPGSVVRAVGAPTGLTSGPR